MLVVTATLISCLIIAGKVQLDNNRLNEGVTEQYQTVQSSQDSSRLDTDRNRQRQRR
jgi:hypothetical protein